MRLFFPLQALADHLTAYDASKEDAAAGDQEPRYVQAVVCEQLVVSDDAFSRKEPREVVGEDVNAFRAKGTVPGAQKRVYEPRVVSLDLDLVRLVWENLRPPPAQMGLGNVPGAVAHFSHSAGLRVVVNVQAEELRKAELELAPRTKHEVPDQLKEPRAVDSDGYEVQHGVLGKRCKIVGLHFALIQGTPEGARRSDYRVRTISLLNGGEKRDDRRTRTTFAHSDTLWQENRLAAGRGRENREKHHNHQEWSNVCRFAYSLQPPTVASAPAELLKPLLDYFSFVSERKLAPVPAADLDRCLSGVSRVCARLRVALGDVESLRRGLCIALVDVEGLGGLVKLHNQRASNVWLPRALDCPLHTCLPLLVVRGRVCPDDDWPGRVLDDNFAFVVGEGYYTRSAKVDFEELPSALEAAKRILCE